MPQGCWGKHRRANCTVVFCLQKDILKSDLIICLVAAVLSFAVSASTVFLSLRVCIHLALHSSPLLLAYNKQSPLCSSGYWEVSGARGRIEENRELGGIYPGVWSYVWDSFGPQHRVDPDVLPLLFPTQGIVWLAYLIESTMRVVNSHDRITAHCQEWRREDSPKQEWDGSRRAKTIIGT